MGSQSGCGQDIEVAANVQHKEVLIKARRDSESATTRLSSRNHRQPPGWSQAARHNTCKNLVPLLEPCVHSRSGGRRCTTVHFTIYRLRNHKRYQSGENSDQKIPAPAPISSENLPLIAGDASCYNSTCPCANNFRAISAARRASCITLRPASNTSTGTSSERNHPRRRNSLARPWCRDERQLRQTLSVGRDEACTRRLVAEVTDRHAIRR